MANSFNTGVLLFYYCTESRPFALAVFCTAISMFDLLGICQSIYAIIKYRVPLVPVIQLIG